MIQIKSATLSMYRAAEFFFFLIYKCSWCHHIYVSLYSKGIYSLKYTEMFHRKQPSYGCKSKIGDEGTLAVQGSVEWVNFLLPPS